MCGKKSTERWNTAQDGMVYEMGYMDMGERWLLMASKQQQRVKSGV